jgi:serine phosphatase RsbU (regulator of sigma subunit)
VAHAGGPARAEQEVDALGALLEESHRLPPDQLAPVVAAAARRLGAGAEALIYIVDFDQKLLIPLGGDDDVLDIEGTVAGRAYRLEQIVSTPRDDGSRSWIPLLDGADRHGVLRLDLDVPLDDDLERRARHFSTTVTELIVSKNALSDVIELARRRRDMDLAAELRWAFLPPLSFLCDFVEIAGVLQPAYEIAGDTFDYAVNGGVVHIGIFDAMGHGLEASRMANLAVGAYRHSRRQQRPLLEILTAIDEVIAEQFGPERFVTGQLATLDATSGILHFLSAGHPRPLLLRRDHVVGELPCDISVPIGLGGVEVQIAEISLEAGDRVVFYTDGVTEARSPGGEEFGVERLGDFVARAAAAHEPAAETVRRLILMVQAHESGNLRDDATVVVLGWPAPRPATAS